MNLNTEVVALSTESIASSSLSVVGAAESCGACGAPVAADQRYCLECGERRVPMSSVLLGGPPTSGELSGPGAGLSSGAGLAPGGAERGARGNTVTVIAGVGVLLLAMGVGVLIGRSGGSKPAAAPAQVISVSQPAAAAGATTPAPATPAKTPTPSSKSGSAAKHGAAKGASGVGSSPSKPAPPTVLQNLRKGGGQSYEQKSKNLPDVVSTG